MTAIHDHVHVYDFGPRPEDLARCVHCGFCLQACPTYVITSLETESPRGRIALARGLSEGTIEATPNVVQHFDLCLQCRACETACPSGVPYGRIIEGARALVQSRSDRPKSWRLRATVLARHVREPLAPEAGVLRSAGLTSGRRSRSGFGGCCQDGCARWKQCCRNCPTRSSNRQSSRRNRPARSRRRLRCSAAASCR